MSTPLQTVYDAYLGGIEEEEWMIEEDMEILARDWRMLLNKAIFRFRFPRIPLTVTAGTTPQEDYFENTLTNDEIQVLGILLEYFWIKR
jgi:hypothetical protein